MHRIIRMIHSLGRQTMALVVGIAALCATNAYAQFGEAAGFAQLLRPEYLSRDIPLIAQGLDLQEDQKFIVEAFFDDYEQGFEEGVEAMRQSFRDMKDQLQGADQQRMLDLVFQPFDDWRAQKEQLGNEFMENIKLILNEQQLARWDSFTRMLFREKTLPEGDLSGESLNLFHVVRDLRLSESEQQVVDVALEAYAVELDQALRARTDVFETAQRKMITSLRDADPTIGLEVIDQQIDLRVRVRDINLSHIDVIAEVVPEDRRDDFRSSAYAEAFPRIFRATPAERLIRTALDLEDLTEDQVENIYSIQNTLAVQLEGLRIRMHETVLTAEPARERFQAELFAARQAGKRLPQRADKMRELFKEREDEELRLMRSLRNVLTPTVFDALPGAQRYVDRIEAQRKQNNPNYQRRSTRDSGGVRGSNNNSSIGLGDKGKSDERGADGSRDRRRDDN